jgi:hypothetical protein
MKRYTHDLMTFKEFLKFLAPFLYDEEPNIVNFHYFSKFQQDLVLHDDNLPDDFETMLYYFHTKGLSAAKKCLPTLYKAYMERFIEVPDDVEGGNTNG